MSRVQELFPLWLAAHDVKVREAALEEAAVECESDDAFTGRGYAKNIRALKNTKENNHD
jgi:hypothetical protein